MHRLFALIVVTAISYSTVGSTQSALLSTLASADRRASQTLPTLTLTATPLTGTVPLTVTFTATCDTCVAYTWSFGDGGIQSVPGPNQTHIYQDAGTYYPIVAATDKNGKGSTGTAIISVTVAIDPYNDADNLYCPTSGGAPTWGAVDGPAKLPTSCYNTALANTPATGSVVNVSTAGQLTTALAAAACGQKITLLAGASFSGNFTVPALSCPTSNYLWIQSSGVASLPAEGARYSVSYSDDTATLTLYAPQMSPCYSGVTSLPGRPTFNCPVTPGTYTAQLITANTKPALTFSAGTSGVRVIGLEFTRSTGTGYVTDLISVGDHGDVNRLVFDRIWCHGTELGDETNRCMRDAAASFFAAIDSYFSDFYCVSVAGACTDSKAIGGGGNSFTSTTEDTIKIVNNFLEAAGENLLHGGTTSNTVPKNFEIRLNLLFKPLVWFPLSPSYNGGYKGGHPVVVKNLGEWKNGQYILEEGNEFVNTWAGFTQHGQALTITPANQNINLCPVCMVTNITVRYNWFNSSNGFALLSIGSNLVNSLPAGGSNWSINNNVSDNIGYCGANGPYCPSSQSVISQTTSLLIPTAALTEHDVSENHNTLVFSASSTGRNALGVSGPSLTTGAQMYNITWTNNLVQSGGGTTGSFGGGDPTNCATGLSGGAALIPACWGSILTFGNNCFVNNGIRSWPGTNITSVASYAAVFTNYNNGNGGNYTVAPGTCKAAGSDGTDPGANIPQLSSVLAGNTAN